MKIDGGHINSIPQSINTSTYLLPQRIRQLIIRNSKAAVSLEILVLPENNV
jgi:hypothetical protein